MLMEDFEAQLADVYNKCPLPGEAKRYVVAHFASMIEDSYRKDMIAYQKKLEEKAKETAQEKTPE